MKKALLTLALLLILVIANSQNTYIFHENCEPPSFNDSLTGSPQWTIQDSIPYPNAPANHYIRATIQPGFYYYLYFPPIIPDTSYQYYYLTFNHICKIDFLDLAVIQFHT